MKSQLEETKRKIKELLLKYGFSTGWVSINPLQTDKIHVVSERDDMPEGEGIKMTIGRSGQDWTIAMENRSRSPNNFPDEEKMLEFIENKLRELELKFGRGKMETTTYFNIDPLLGVV